MTISYNDLAHSRSVAKSIEAAGSIVCEAFSNTKYNTMKVAIAAQVAGLYQHTCYTARYLGSGNIFCRIFQYLAGNIC